MPNREGSEQIESDEEYQGDGREAIIGNRLAHSVRVDLFGTMTAGVEKSVLEGPVFGQIHPTVVLILPAKMPELTDGGCRKDLLGQGGYPKPFVIGGV